MKKTKKSKAKARKPATRKSAARKPAARKATTKRGTTRKATVVFLSPKQQIDALISKVASKNQSLFRAARTAMRKRFPAANELVYDYPHSLVVGYSPSEHGVESVVALSASADGLRLYFMNGPKLSDPKKLLLGAGKQTRFIQIESLKTLKLPDTEGFMAGAAATAKTPFAPAGGGKLIIKTSSAKPGSRRKAAR